MVGRYPAAQPPLPIFVMTSFRPLPTPRSEVEGVHRLAGHGLKRMVTTPVPSPALSTGISPTYDLLDGYSELDSAAASPSSDKQAPVIGRGTEEHRQTWRRISGTHDGLIAQRRREKGDNGECPLGSHGQQRLIMLYR